jgi:hypothetical protein
VFAAGGVFSSSCPPARDAKTIIDAEMKVISSSRNPEELSSLRMIAPDAQAGTV